MAWQGLLGYIYADLYWREGKSEQPAQFTIRSGRQISPGRYQTPIVGLVCGFRANKPREPTLLNHGEVETLFHEMGHAMHCMFPCCMAKTRYNGDFTTFTLTDPPPTLHFPSHAGADQVPPRSGYAVQD